MKIRFYAHASFRFEADGVALVTDPYTPGISGFRPIDEPAHVVVMSSRTDDFHSDPSHIRSEPVVINALELPPAGVTVRGVPIRGFEAYESRTFDYQSEFGRDPDANALYHFGQSWTTSDPSTVPNYRDAAGLPDINTGSCGRI